MVQNKDIFISVVKALLTSMAPQTEKRNARPDANDGGASRFRKRPATTNMGIERSITGADRMATARANHVQSRFMGRTSSYTT